MMETICHSASRKWCQFSPSGGTAWRDVQAIAERIFRENPGQPLTVIGNCMSGGQALSLLGMPQVRTAVVCQPAAPSLAFTEYRRHSFGVPQARVEAALAALKSDPRKRLICIQYRDDKVAPLERVRWLSERVIQQGSTDRHHVFVGVVNGTEKPGGAESMPGWITVEVKNPSGHSTVTGAQDWDRLNYRKALFLSLGLRFPY